jgi:hypothetical protein
MPVSNLEEESNQTRNGGAFVNRNDRYRRNYKQLDSQYSVWQAKYVEVADYIALGRGRFLNEAGNIANQKSQAASKVINNTATDALHMLGAGLHGGLSSPARPWFQLGFTDEAMNKFSAYRSWLDDCEKRMYAAFKRSNFYGIIHNIYEEIGGFGTGAMMVDDSPEHGLLFHYFTVGDYRFAIKVDGRTHCFYRKFKMQAVQVEQFFGKEAISDKVKRLLESNPYEWVEIMHCIEPNADYNPEKMDSKPFSSIYFEVKESEARLSDKGYEEMPVVTPRWQALSNEAYGWGPGLESIGLAKAIQRMERQSFMASDKMLDPPLALPSSMKDRMLDLSPGGKNTYDEANAKIQRMVEINPAVLDSYESKIARVEAKIRRNFHNELFLMIASEDPAKMTATEVLARKEEKMLMVGPTIERLEYEYLSPIVERVFAILARQGQLPPPPAELQNVEYKIDFVSLLAQAQKLIGAQAMQSYLGLAERVAAVDPGSVTKTNWDTFLEESADMVSLPSKVVRTEDEVGAIRQQLAEQRAAEQQQMAMAQGVENVSKLGNTPAGEDTALGKLEAETEGGEA